MTVDTEAKIGYKMTCCRCDMKPPQNTVYNHPNNLSKSKTINPSSDVNLKNINTVIKSYTLEKDHIYPCVYSVLLLVTMISLLGDIVGIDGNAYSLLKQQFNSIFKLLPSLISLQLLSACIIWLIIRSVNGGLSSTLSHIILLILFTILIYLMGTIKSNMNTFTLSCTCVLEIIRIMMKTYAVHRSFHGFLNRNSIFANYFSSVELKAFNGKEYHTSSTNTANNFRTLAPNANRSLLNTIETTDQLISTMSHNVNTSNETFSKCPDNSLKDSVIFASNPQSLSAVTPRVLFSKGHVPHLISLLTHSYDRYKSFDFKEEFVTVNSHKEITKSRINDNFSLSHIIYYYYSPTMIYKPSYNLKKERSISKIIISFLKCCWKLYLAAYLLNSYTIRFLNNYIQNGGTCSFISFNFHTTFQALYHFLSISLSMLVLFVLLFRMFFIHWLGLWSEILMYNDQPLYLDWWTSYNYRIFLRKWNPIIQEWLWLYVYNDIRTCYSKSLSAKGNSVKRNEESHIKIGKGNNNKLPDNFKSFASVFSKYLPKLTLILLSAIIHELIVYHILGIFLPVLFVLFGILCPFFSMSTVSFGSVEGWTIIFFISHGIGLGIIVTLYYEQIKR